MENWESAIKCQKDMHAVISRWTNMKYSGRNIKSLACPFENIWILLIYLILIVFHHGLLVLFCFCFLVCILLDFLASPSLPLLFYVCLLCLSCVHLCLASLFIVLCFPALLVSLSCSSFMSCGPGFIKAGFIPYLVKKTWRKQ